MKQAHIRRNAVATAQHASKKKKKGGSCYFLKLINFGERVSTAASQVTPGSAFSMFFHLLTSALIAPAFSTEMLLVEDYYIAMNHV